jgi:hypothetical protein
MRLGCIHNLDPVFHLEYHHTKIGQYHEIGIPLDFPANPSVRSAAQWTLHIDVELLWQGGAKLLEDKLFTVSGLVRS